MVNVGLRSFLWEQKSEQQKVQRELFNLNGGTYEGYRAYIRFIKDSSAQLNSGSSSESLDAAAASLLSTTESWQSEASYSAAAAAASSKAPNRYVFSGMKHVFKDARCAVHLIKFGRFTADLLAFAAADGAVYIAGTSEGRGGILQVLRAHSGRVQDLDWASDNSFLLSCGWDGDLCLWHVESGGLVRKLEQGAGLWTCQLACCRFHPVNQNLLFVGTAAGEVLVVNSSTGLPVSRVALPTTARGGVGVACLEVTPTQVVVADSRGGLHLYACTMVAGQLRPLQPLCSTAPAHAKSYEPACMECIAHSMLAHGPAVLLVDCQGRILLYRVQTKGTAYHRLELACEAAVGAQSSRRVRAALCPAVGADHSEVLAMGGEDCSVHVYDIGRHTRQPLLLAQLQGHGALVLDVSWAFDESMLASCDTQGTVIVWAKSPGVAATTAAVPAAAAPPAAAVGSEA